MWEKTVLLLLLIVANGAPILVAWRLGPRWAWPLDAGLVLGDGHRLLGESARGRGRWWRRPSCPGCWAWAWAWAP